jgi:peptidoglycan hydrolase-like protein with peptidoglycan-binding domain
VNADALREAMADELDELDIDDDLLEEALEAIESWDDEAAEGAEETAESAWNSELHPRAAAGSSAGGQFSAGGGGSSSAASKSAPAHSGKPSAPTRKGPAALAYDAKTGRGPGYGQKGGDARVRKLQTALNRLGLTDGRGRKLVIDGKLGPRTTESVKAAQRKLGIPADGKVTPQLLMKLAAAKSLTKKPKPAKAAKVPAKKAPAVHAPPKQAAPKPRTTSTTTTSGGHTVTVTRRSQEGDMSQPEGTYETADRIEGHILGVTESTDGGRAFRVRIIAAGDSKNGRRYPAKVLQEAVGLYEGAKAYDHHRSAEELRSSTIAGLIGHYRNVEASADGLDGDLVLLPSASHAAEALDATVAAQAAGLPPLVGISHDAMTYTRPITVGRRRMQEAVAIAKVHSADVVADPAAGGKAVRVLAGGIEEGTDPEGTEPDGESNEEDDVAVTSETMLAALQTATPEQLAALRDSLSKVEPTTTAVPEPTTEAAPAGIEKTSFLGGLMVKEKVAAAGLPERVAESLREALPDRFVESDIDGQIAAIKAALGLVERADLRPTVSVSVTQESQEKKAKALDAFFAGDFVNGYRSFREAVLDFTGYRPSAWGEDVNKVIMRECIGTSDYDADGRLQGGANRATESLSASTWNLVLGDSITRRMVAEYNQPNLQTWRQIVSSIVPINDFRTQRIDRIGGYGVLPGVNQGQPYQPLTSPTNEEVTYAISKRGGTEDITLEMIANDDVRAISKIPVKLGLAAAQTVYRYVWDMVVTNANIYDSSALFTTGHGNYVNSGSGSALSQSALSAARLLMTSQTAYGDTTDYIAPTPQFLVYVNDLEELAWQLCHSAVALPTPANTPPNSTGAANTPNIHQGLTPIRLDYPSSTTAWWTIADPNMIPTIEMGFYLGRQEPELFTQNDPTVGSVFNADKTTYKVRHAYNGAVLDYRGFCKGN